MTQKTLFRGDVVSLLTVITNYQRKAQDLLSNHDKDMWDKLKFPRMCDSYRLESLQGTFTSCKENLDLVSPTVESISREVENFRYSNSVAGGQVRLLPL